MLVYCVGVLGLDCCDGSGFPDGVGLWKVLELAHGPRRTGSELSEFQASTQAGLGAAADSRGGSAVV